MTPNIETWENEGGSPAPAGVSTGPPAANMTGSDAQVEWAGRIRRLVDAEFDRVAATFRSVAARQAGGARAETEAVIAILEDKRAEVMARKQAGYFIHDWQEIGDQVRRMIFDDPRYGAIQSNRNKRLTAS